MTGKSTVSSKTYPLEFWSLASLDLSWSLVKPKSSFQVVEQTMQSRRGTAVLLNVVDCVWAYVFCWSLGEGVASGRVMRWEELGNGVGRGGIESKGLWPSPWQVGY